MLEKIAHWLTRKPKLVALIALLMLIPSALGYVATRVNYDILSYLPEELPSSSLTTLKRSLAYPTLYGFPTW